MLLLIPGITANERDSWLQSLESTQRTMAELNDMPDAMLPCMNLRLKAYSFFEGEGNAHVETHYRRETALTISRLIYTLKMLSLLTNGLDSLAEDDPILADGLRYITKEILEDAMQNTLP